MKRTLHAALMPFPSPQGTQGAVASMVRALARRGDDVTLFVHPHGDGTASDLPLVRSPAAPFGRSLRSGPTLGRAALDALAVPALMRAARGRAVFAHNVEAAFAARMTRAPYVYVAHTHMARELPYYAQRRPSALVPVGRGLDALAAGPRAVLAAISPLLVRDLTERFEREAHYLPIPWEPAELTSAADRAHARAAAGIGTHTIVLGYTGNLDGYQGTELLLPTLAAVNARTRAVLVVATESDARALRADAQRAGLAESLLVEPLSNDAARARAHALFDVLLVPRTCEGGVPIKLLDALARGVPVVAAHGATAGLPCGAAVLATRAEPESLAAACLLAAPVASRDALAEAGHAYLRAHHTTARFLAAHDALARTLFARS